MSRWDTDDLERIFDRTSGRCHLCHKKLAWKNYGAPKEARGAWHVDHSRALARGGVDDLRNAMPACVSCNCSKRDGSNHSIRSRHKVSRAPLSRQRRREAKAANAVGGAGIGALIGGALLGRPGAALGAALGSLLGFEIDPDKG